MNPHSHNNRKWILFHILKLLQKPSAIYFFPKNQLIKIVNKAAAVCLYVLLWVSFSWRNRMWMATLLFCCILQPDPASICPHSHQRRRPHSGEGEFVRKSFITEGWIKKEDSPENWETWLSEALWGAREYFPTGISRWDIIIIIIVFVVIFTKTLGFPSGNCKEHVMTKMQRPTNFNLFLSQFLMYHTW